jgi:hypothetical protein
MISYRLKNGKSGEITDPRILRLFWSRMYYPKWRDVCPPITRLKLTWSRLSGRK